MRELVSQREREREKAKYQSSGHHSPGVNQSRNEIQEGREPIGGSVAVEMGGNWSSGAAVPDFQSPFGRSVVVIELADLFQLSLSLFWMVISKWATGQAAGEGLKLGFKIIIIELIYSKLSILFRWPFQFVHWNRIFWYRYISTFCFGITDIYIYIYIYIFICLLIKIYIINNNF